MPCKPSDLSINPPSGPSGPPIPGIGLPFALPVPNLAPLLDGMPEDLMDLLNKLQLLVPSMALKPQLAPNAGKSIYDGIMKLLDQFMPFLALYKFFLPVLNLIICIIEVLCALTNPFKLISALKRLFTQCLPEFLNLFPIFAIILMLISLLLLLLALIEYIISQILALIEKLLRNINALMKAFQSADATSVLAIAHKIGALLCIFQNFFVILAIFAVIIQVIKDILALIFNIPPCQDGEEDDESCCTPDVCPAIIKNGPYTRNTGVLQYLPKVGAETDVVLPLPPPFDKMVFDIRQETWQIYDTNQEIAQMFSNIAYPYDVIMFPKPVFFPTDVAYTFETNYRQAAYTVDIKMNYDPSGWGRAGTPKNIIFKNCIVLSVPTYNLSTYDNGKLFVKNGVLKIAGGQGYEEDGTTILNGFNEDGTPGDFQATLNNFIHLDANTSTNPLLLPTDAKTITNVEYTFKPNNAVLIGKNLITAGCDPGLSAARNFMSSVAFGDVGVKTEQLKEIINGVDFPNPDEAQECLATSIVNFRNNLSITGLAEFKASTDACLQNLKNNTIKAIKDLIGIGFDPTKSDFTLDPKTQFTSKPIKVKVNLREKNGASITNGLTEEISQDIATRIKPTITFGEIDNFIYSTDDLAFVANITSDLPGKGTIMMAFDDNLFVKDVISEDLNVAPARTIQKLDYQFIYTPTSATGDNDGAPRRDEKDIAQDAGDK